MLLLLNCMPQKSRHILITSALYYANGDIHLGHLLETVETDIWARFQRLSGNTCYYISGSDAHGTAIMLSAEKQAISPEKFVENIRQDHINDFEKFHIAFDNFDTTHSPENKTLTLSIYHRLQKNKNIITKTVTQFFDPEKEMFLADRFIKGECPKCGAQDQYGDNCEVCGAVYNATDLKNPRSALTGAAPIQKESEHYFFDLNHYTDFLKTWTQAGALQTPIANKLQEWFKVGLHPWDISRDPPYFGFEIPDTKNKYFYVWLDAPIGYMASFENLCTQKNIDFDAYWKNNETELYHVIGKDIISFHTLFWPAMLKACDYRLPSKVIVHGFVTVDGEKMSKSRGTYITAKAFAEHLPPEYLRYYYAAKLNNQIEDIDFNYADFSARINSDLVGKYVNLASRCAGFITKKFDGKLAATLHDEKLFNDFSNAKTAIAEEYEQFNFQKVVRDIMALTDRANQYVDHFKPWALAKENGKENDVQLVCTEALNLFRLLTLYLKPILPETAKKVEVFLNIEPLTWADCKKPLLNHVIQPFTPLMQRVTDEQLKELS